MITNAHKDHMKNLTGTSRHIFGNIQIQIKNRTNGDHDQINNCRLFEIIFKRFKKLRTI